MRPSAFHVVIMFAICALSSAPALATTAQQHEAAARREFGRMHWAGGRQKLSTSNGTFSVPSGAKMVVGAEAQRADELVNGTTAADSEGFVRMSHRTLYLSYSDSGYVTADDWKDVNSDELLKSFTQVTEQNNEARVRSGISPLYTDGWIQRPTFDATRKSVRWIVGLHNASGKFVNAVALQLGRRGYERFTLASTGADPKGDAAILARSVNDYQFNPGFRFSDYVQGDKLAGYGIAALVGTAAGATIAKTVGFGAILLLIKKFFFIILAFGAGLVVWLKRLFTGNRMSVGPPKAPPAV